MGIETIKHLRVVQIKNNIVKLVKKQRISSATSINIFFDFFHMGLGWIQKWFDSSQEKKNSCQNSSSQPQNLRRESHLRE